MKSLLTLILIFLTIQLYSQTDTTFWFVAPEVTNNNGDSPILLRISTLHEAANVTISMPANEGYTANTGGESVKTNSTQNEKVPIVKP